MDKNELKAEMTRVAKRIAASPKDQNRLILLATHLESAQKFISSRFTDPESSTNLFTEGGETILTRRAIDVVTLIASRLLDVASDLEPIERVFLWSLLLGTDLECSLTAVEHALAFVEQERRNEED